MNGELEKNMGIRTNQLNLYLILLMISLFEMSGCAITPNNPSHSDGQISKSTIPFPAKPTIVVDDQVRIETAWDRLILTNTIHVDTGNPRVRAEIDNYLLNVQYLEKLSERASPFLYHILEKLEKEQLPIELALLPIIESAWRPSATSKHGAAGLWQFMPATARHLNTQMGALYDGRRDLIVSTDKASQYLSILSSQFNHDWLLTLAAYNAGPGTISRAVKKQNIRGEYADFWNLSLPRETEFYVPKYLAILHIFRNPQLYNINLHPIKNTHAFDRVEINKQLHLETIASNAGISKHTLFNLNAAYFRGVTQANSKHHLLVPIEHVTKTKAVIQQLPETSFPVTALKHKIRRGETLSSISVRYRVSISDIKLLNRISRSRIRAGKHLLIPAPINSGKSNKYIVKRGDTLWSIAKMHKINLNKLARHNQIGQNTILFPGMVLVLKSL